MERYKKVRLASIFGIIGNIFLFVIKLITGLLTNSRAMLADSFNRASDVFSSFMTLIGNKISSIPSDDDHNLGHGKAEYIYSMLISIAMFGLSFTIFKDSFISLFIQSEYNFSMWLIIICLITIITKFILYIYTRKIAKEQNNLLIEANSKDHRNDCLITILNLVSCLFAKYGIYFLDGITGIIISLWILFTGIKIFKASYDVLMDKSISEETKRKVFEIINKHEEIKKVIHFNATPVGYKYQISFTIYVDGNLSTFESHEIANRLEKEIANKLEQIYLTVIHVNPL